MRINGWKNSILIMILIVLSLVSVSAQDQVVVNSKDWQEVYVGSLYAALKGVDFHYVVEETQGLQLYKEVLNRQQKETLLVEGENPLMFGYKKNLEDIGLTIETVAGDNPRETSLILARRAVIDLNVSNFIILNDNLGYNSIAITSYALITNSTIIYADKNNINEITNFLDSVNVDNILIYGKTDGTVKAALTAYNPTIIDTEDKFNDNMRLIEKFLKLTDTKQVILTSGDFLEPTFYSNEFPILLVGSSNLPDKVVEFLQDQDMKTAVIVGYELGQNAVQIRDRTGLRVFLKYGQGRGGQLYALDIFPIPSHNPKIDIKEIRYNTATQQLEVVYENIGDVFTYVQTLSHIVLDETGENTELGRIGDKEAFFLDTGSVETVTYDLKIDNPTEDMIVNSKIALGDSLTALDKLFIKNNILVTLTNFMDESDISLVSATYYPGSKRIDIIVNNNGVSDVYVLLKLMGITIDGIKTDVRSEQQIISSQETATFKIKLELTDRDLEINNYITVNAKYGEKELSMGQELSEDLPLLIGKSASLSTLTIIIIVVVILFLLLLIRRGRQRK